MTGVLPTTRRWCAGLPVFMECRRWSSVIRKGAIRSSASFETLGCPKPEGYRKALRAMKLADKFDRPIFSFIDTPGAYPGIDAEERGQAEAIAYQPSRNDQTDRPRNRDGHW